MNGSRTIRVLKRDGSREDFSPEKLAAAMDRAMRGIDGHRRYAVDLAGAIHIYLAGDGRGQIRSAALLEMVIKVLRRVGLDQAVRNLEEYHYRREDRRAKLCIRHESGAVTRWDKGWLCEFARRSWNLMASTARIVAGEVEGRLLNDRQTFVARSAVLESLNEVVCEFGLAEAVPVNADDAR